MLVSKRNLEGGSLSCSRCNTVAAHPLQQYPWGSTKLKQRDSPELMAYSNVAGEIRQMPHRNAGLPSLSKVKKLTASFIAATARSAIIFFPFVAWLHPGRRSPVRAQAVRNCVTVRRSQAVAMSAHHTPPQVGLRTWSLRHRRDTGGDMERWVMPQFPQSSNFILDAMPAPCPNTANLFHPLCACRDRNHSLQNVRSPFGTSVRLVLDATAPMRRRCPAAPTQLECALSTGGGLLS